jgi:hypothetical protein
MLFNTTRKARQPRQPSHLHYGTAAKARQTLKYLRTRPRGEQMRSAQTMYSRAKYHAKQTPDMREAMKVYRKFIRILKR